MTDVFNKITEPVTIFQERRLPEEAIIVGYAALIQAYNLPVPLPINLSAISSRHKQYQAEGWKIFTPRHAPKFTLEGHLTFALKYEGLDLVILKYLFKTLDSHDIETLVKDKPTSAYARRIWFLYEWLLEQELNIPDIQQGRYVDVVDTKLQWAIQGMKSRRHRVMNNLPGPREFCPMVWHTPKIESYTKANLSSQAQAAVDQVSASLLARTAAFLLLKDSKSSFAIEGESPPQDRIQRWGRTIREAGRHPLSLEELLRLQKIVIGDARFVHLGLRTEGGFVGEHERDSRLPLPEHISARHEDVPNLIEGMIEFDGAYAEDLPAIVAAGILAFGFIYTHPFEDGNGRIHRYLIHHILSRRGFNPPGVVFPVSATILERIEDYKEVLESYSKRLIHLIQWRPTDSMNVEVLNDTIDYYRYFDATPHVEFLYECVEKTILVDLPEEVKFLEHYDAYEAKVLGLVEMPTSKVDLLFHFLKQNDGKLSKRARENEFKALTEDEVKNIEKAYSESFS